MTKQKFDKLKKSIIDKLMISTIRAALENDIQKIISIYTHIQKIRALSLTEFNNHPEILL